MQIKEKLEVFRDFTLDVAKENSSQLTAQYEAVCRQELEEFRKNKQTEMEHRLQMEERSLRRQMNSKVSREMQRQKHILDECKRQWKEKLMQEIRLLLKEYQNTAAYQRFLIAKIGMAKKVAGQEPVIIYINVSDKEKKAELEKQTGVGLTVSKIDFGGGIRAVIESRNILIDESFLTRLEQEETYL
ncbi:hypothetical protein D3Z36_14455 [Lachnospiraceae bacterium]|nr:hypothetical protein [Lachnospiraceae bacterium]